MSKFATGAIHHIMLTVQNIKRTRDFYHNILGMDIIAEHPEGHNIAFSNGQILLAARTPAEPIQTPTDDKFNENRMGLDHLSLSVNSRDDLNQAIAIFDANNVSHGKIKDLSENGLPILVLAFRDPDNIQLELTAPA